MNEDGPSRPPLSRAAPILAVGVAFVLIGGLVIGIFIGQKPVPPVSPAAETLPASVPAAPPPVVAPDLPRPVPMPSPDAAPPPAPAVAPPDQPPAPAAPPQPVAPAPIASPVPERKPAHEAAAPKPARASAHRPAAKSARGGAAAAKPASRRAHGMPPAPAHRAAHPAIGGPWVVQLGAFENDDHAKLLVDTLAYHGHAARIASRRDRNGREWFFVQTPGYATRAAAEAAAKRLSEAEQLPTIVLRARPGG
jgi:cell division septation protein DedD